MSTIMLLYRVVKKQFDLMRGIEVIEDDEDSIDAQLRDISSKAGKGQFVNQTKLEKRCPHCGKVIKSKSSPLGKPKPRICNQILVYFYIALFIIILLLMAILASITVLYPAYSVFVKPLSTTNFDSLIKNRTNTIPKENPYSDLVVLGSNITTELFVNCSNTFPSPSHLFNLTEDMIQFTSSKLLNPDQLIQYKQALQNTVFAPFLEYIPYYNGNIIIDIPKLMNFVNTHPIDSMDIQYLYDFMDEYPILLDNVLDITVRNLTDPIFMDNIITYLFKPQFIVDTVSLFNNLADNVTEIETLAKNSTSDYSDLLVSLRYGNLTHVEGLTDSIVTDINQMSYYVSEYYNIINIYVNAIPTFSQCAANYTHIASNEITDWAITQYTSYFRKQFFFTLFMILLIAACIAAVVYLIYDIYIVIQNTYKYGKEELNRVTTDYKNELRDATGGILFASGEEKPVITFSDSDDDTNDSVPLFIKKRK